MLINGASGSVGSAGVRISNHVGATVTAVCSGKKAEIVCALGAVRAINDKTQDVVAKGITYDMVEDTVASLPWGQAQHAIRPGGKMVLIAGTTSDMLFGSQAIAIDLHVDGAGES